MVVGRHQSVARRLVGDRLVDRVECEKRVPGGEVHLGDHPLGELGAEKREVDVRGGAPGVVMVAPRIGTWLDRGEVVGAVGIGEAAAGAREVRVEWRGMLVTLVDVTTGGVGLPDLHELVAHRPTVAVGDAPRDDHPLADRVAAALDREVRLEWVDVGMAEYRCHQLDALGVGVVEAFGGGAAAVNCGTAGSRSWAGSRRPGHPRGSSRSPR